jgi:hypothetical protein
MSGRFFRLADAMRGALAGARGVLPGVAPCARAGTVPHTAVFRRTKQCLGVLALAALAAASVSAGSASAATGPIVKTKAQWQAAMARVPRRGAGCYHASYPVLQWHAVKCAVAPKFPLAPVPPAGLAAPTARRTAGDAAPATVGNGDNYVAQVSGLIYQATASFHHVNANITEKGKVDNEGPKVANAFSLQLNTEPFATPACSGSSDPAACLGWQQFIYLTSGSAGYILMQYWLLNYNATCPANWATYGNSCYTDSPGSTVTPLTAQDLASVQFSANAFSGGDDAVSLSVGSGQAAYVSNNDDMLDLASAWNTTEWGVFGDAGGAEAYFGSGTKLEAETTLATTTGSAPVCFLGGFTGETNNLSLASTPALGSKPLPTMVSKETKRGSGTSSCAAAA